MDNKEGIILGGEAAENFFEQEVGYDADDPKMSFSKLLVSPEVFLMHFLFVGGPTGSVGGVTSS